MEDATATPPAPKKTSTARTSLTQQQLQTDVGLNLLCICQSVTQDGRLSNDEIGELRAWVDNQQHHDLPAINRLSATLSAAFADGIITPEERLAIYKTIEAILPTEYRQIASDLRRMATAEDKATDKAAREAQKIADREQKSLERGQSANFMVAGTRYEGRADIIAEYARPNDAAYLLRERNNKHSKHATKVMLTNGSMMGYVPEDVASWIAPLLDDGWTHKANITKVLDRGRAPIPVITVTLHDQKANITGALTEHDVTAKVEEQAKARFFSLLWKVLAWCVGIGVFIAWIKN